MTTRIDKTTLLAKMQEGYRDFEALLQSLSEEQLTTPGVNSTWSIKDNIAHLSVWEKHTIARLQAIQQGTVPPVLAAGPNYDEINERFYQENKDRPLSEILAEFRAVFQQLEQEVQNLRDEELNQPRTWLKGWPVSEVVAGNTYEHYQEHGQIIKDWLARNTQSL